ncbi:YadA-like family protein [Bartonella sp. WD16.2]|uniref:YadA-like family protein n=1 Tax=Bartonella sp. WD16.2 TaxID=1933904 RepID=UPI0009C25277|nr:YadA-like family protein [Bartonella sp. WD16.2]AQX19295.1 Coiled stalk of trimeric autotransporter adhesin [Bartonella sp. WD16.2]
MKKLHITPKNKGLNGPRSLSEVSLVRVVSLGAVMASLLSSVSPVFASHLSSTGAAVQSANASQSTSGVISASARDGRVVMTHGDRSCGVDHVVSRSSSTSGKKRSAEEHYKKLTANQLSDDSGGYSFESSCGADTSVNALIDVETTRDWLLKENNAINRSSNAIVFLSADATSAGGYNQQNGLSIIGENSSRGVLPEKLEYWCDSDGLARRSVCIGTEARADAADAVALGSYSRGHRGAGVSGYNARVDGHYAVNRIEWTSTLGEISIGDEPLGKTRQITGVSAGTHDTDAVNVAQLKSLKEWIIKDTVTSRWRISVDGQNVTVIGDQDGVDFSAQPDSNIKIVKEGNHIQFNLVEDLKVSSITLGSGGPKLSASGIDAGYKTITHLVGGDIRVDSTEAVNGFQLYKVASATSKYFGGEGDVLEGHIPRYRIQGEVQADVGSAFEAVDTVLTRLTTGLYDAASNSFTMQDPETHAITIGAKTDGTVVSIAARGSRPRVLTGLADGHVSENSTNAITGSQLWQAMGNVVELKGAVSGVDGRMTIFTNRLSRYLDGNANLAGGQEPTYIIQKKEHNSVGRAFVGVDKTLTDLYEKVDILHNSVGDDSLVAQSQESQLITIGGQTGGNKISITNNKGEARVLTGLKGGDVSESSIEAVTGKQLYEVGQDIEGVNAAVTNVEGNITTFGGNISRYLGGGAYVLAGTAPTYSIQKKEHNDIGSAFAGVDNTLTDLYEKVDVLHNSVGDDSLVAQSQGSQLITIGGQTGGNKISIINNKRESRVLTGLAKGRLLESSIEAVTGAQLYEMGQDVNGLRAAVLNVVENFITLDGNISRYLGGGADVLAGTAPTYSIQKKEHNDIGSAFAGVDNTLTDLYEKVDGLHNSVGDDSLVAQSQESQLITIGGQTGGNKISITNNKGESRVLTGLANGDVSESSIEAVTGKQLYEVGQDIEGVNAAVTNVERNVTTLDGNISRYLGGGAYVLAGTAPTYSIQKKEHNDIGSAFAGVDSSLTDLYEKVDGLHNSVGDDSLVAQGQESQLITIGGQTGGNKISITNNKGEARVLTGLKDGDVSESSIEAVTGKQLYEVGQDIEGVNAAVTNVERNVTTLDGNISRYLGGGADVLAGTAPTYSIQKKEHNDIGSAFAGVDNTLTDLYEKVDVLHNSVGDDSLVAQSQESQLIAIGGQTGGNKISITNNKGESRVLTGLANGDVSESSIEAVTGKQLYEVGQDIEGVNAAVTNVERNVTTLDGNISRYLGGGAYVLAGTAPTYSIQKKEHNDIGSAFAGVDSSLTDLYEKVDGLENGSVTVGNGLVEQHPVSNLITIGAKTDGTKVSITNKDGESRVLTGLANGDVSESSIEAVTGSQLYEVGQDIEGVNAAVTNVERNVTTLDGNISRYLGGGAYVLAGTAPTYSIQKKEHNDIGSAFAGVDNTLTDLYEKVDGLENGSVTVGNGLVEQHPVSNLITIGAKTDGTKVSITNKDGESRVLTGLANGDVSESSIEAVTGKQLYEVGQDVEDLSAAVTNVERNVTTLDGNISRYLGGGAYVLAGTAPTYSIQKKEHNDIGSAFAGVDSSLTDLYEKVDGLENGSVTVGNGLVEQHPVSNLITIGAKTDGTKVSITNKDGESRVLTGLANGDVSESSIEAVTGSQLYEVGQDVEDLSAAVTNVERNVTTLDGNISRYLGGGAYVLAGTAPTYSIQKKEHNDIGSAFAGVDSSLTDLYEKVDGLENGSVTVGNGLVEQHPVSNLITIGAKTDGTKVSITNKDGESRVLTGLANGDVSESSIEAVTGSQLYEVGQDVEDLSAAVTNVERNVTTLDGNISRYLGGGAYVLAGTAPTYSIQKKEHNDIGSAFAGVDSSLTDLYEKVDGLENGSVTVGNGLVEQHPVSNLITIGAKTDGTKVSITNKDGESRVLTGLANGDVSESSIEAVTGSQLYEVGQDIEGVNAAVTNVERNVTTLDGNISRYLGGGADVLAGTAPTYSIQKKEHNDIGSAFAGVDNTLTDLYEKVDVLHNSVGDDSLVAQSQESQLIAIGGQTGGNKISITNNKGESRVLTGLANGDVSESSIEAVTGSQLYEVGQDVEDLSAAVTNVERNVTTLDGNISRYLGGGAYVLAGTAPTYSIQKKEHNDIGSAFAGVDSSLTDLYEKVDGLENGSVTVGNGLVEQHPVSNLITIGAKTDGTKVSITNKDGESRVLTGLANGDVSESSIEAVTGSQLYEVGQDIEGVNAAVTNVERNVTTLDGNISRYLGGGADVLAGTAPTYSIQKKEHNDIGSAFAGVDNTLTDLYEKVDVLHNSVGDDSLVAQSQESQLIAIGGQTGGNKISITNNKGESRVLTGLANGDVSESSIEAVTGSQLYEMNTTIARYFGGGAGYEGGQWTDPTFSVVQFGTNGKNVRQDYHTVADAFGAVNSSLSGLNDHIQQVENQANSSVNSDGLNWSGEQGAYDANHGGQAGKITNVANGAIEQGSSDAITGDQLWQTNEKVDGLENKVDSIINDVDILTEGAVIYDKDEHGAKVNSITLVGVKEGDPVVIDNVANGRIEKGSKQAINGGQLHDYVQEQTKLTLADANKYTDEKIENIVGGAVAQANTYTDTTFDVLNYKIKNVQKEARQAAAIGLAVSNLRYADIPGAISVAFGSGLWRSQSASSFGASYTSENGKARSSLSAATSGGHWGVGAGVSLILKR